MAHPAMLLAGLALLHTNSLVRLAARSPWGTLVFCWPLEWDLTRLRHVVTNAKLLALQTLMPKRKHFACSQLVALGSPSSCVPNARSSTTYM